MPNAAYTPEILANAGVAVGAAVVAFTFSAKVGCVIIENLGPDAVFLRWDGTNPTAAFGDDVWQLNSGKALCLDASEITSVRAICAAGKTASVQIVGWRSLGSLRGVTG